MCAFLCAIDESVWGSVKIGWVRLKPKAKWNTAAIVLANANSKAINAIFCGVFTDKFHKISHVHGRSLRLPMRVPRRSRTQSYKFSLLDLRK